DFPTTSNAPYSFVEFALLLRSTEEHPFEKRTVYESYQCEQIPCYIHLIPHSASLNPTFLYFWHPLADIEKKLVPCAPGGYFELTFGESEGNCSDSSRTWTVPVAAILVPLDFFC
ncbi:hypothetical protein TNCV_4502421, partial [Trichonephila clavipes]